MNGLLRGDIKNFFTATFLKFINKPADFSAQTDRICFSISFYIQQFYAYCPEIIRLQPKLSRAALGRLARKCRNCSRKVFFYF